MVINIDLKRIVCVLKFNFFGMNDLRPLHPWKGVHVQKFETLFFWLNYLMKLGMDADIGYIALWELSSPGG